ncbi:MAG: squalene/phytoene synthase family protein [Alphaproteobacteria bacterium]|nr:squalene/phytoene synthase family protein [Alphaproteobacteria bacterium]
MSQSASYIADQLRADDRDRYLMALLAPADRRADLMTLYAFDAELARIRGRVSEVLIGRIKLQWWRDVIAGVYEGKGAPKGNPLTEALAGAIDRRKLTREHFEKMIATRERDMSGDEPDGAMTTVADLERYAEGTQGRLLWLALEILGVSDQASRDAARHVGIAYALSGLLRAVAFEAHVGAAKIPLAAGAPLAVLSQDMASCAADHLARARQLRSQVDRRAVPALLSAVSAGSFLKREAAGGGDLFRQHPASDTTNLIALMWAWASGRY